MWPKIGDVDSKQAPIRSTIVRLSEAGEQKTDDKPDGEPETDANPSPSPGETTSSPVSRDMKWTRRVRRPNGPTEDGNHQALASLPEKPQSPSPHCESVFLPDGCARAGYTGARNGV